MPQSPTYDILGIGNAIVDVLAPVPEAFLSKHDMHKGAMALIDAATAERLYADLPAGTESSGGSAANTCAVAALLGAKVAYLGKVANDTLGSVFRHDISAVGVHFPTPPATSGAPTARCLIAVTDATPPERSRDRPIAPRLASAAESGLTAELVPGSNVVDLELPER